MRRPTWAAHDHAVLLDELPRIGRAVLVALDAATGITLAVERVNIAFLLVCAMLLTASQPPAQHGAMVPDHARLNLPRRIRLVA